MPAPHHDVFEPLPFGAVNLGAGIAADRSTIVRDYVVSMKPRLLLQNHLLEAGLIQINEQPTDLHWGWESPTSMVRGTFVGKWLSAAAHLWATTGDHHAKGLLDEVVAGLARCQQANGNGWVAGIPEKYLQWIKAGRAMWAPMYVAHKPLMGCYEAHVLAGNDQALQVLVDAAGWFTRFTDDMSRDELDDLLDWETGGMQEVWADLYGLTGAEEHLELVHRFDRRRLFDRLIAGDDPLTNQHANQTVPEIMAAARAYEVTGDRRWREAVEAYWACAVTDRGWFATGGQTYGETWTPKHDFRGRLGRSNQEHCVAYNLMRLAERLLRWTGEPVYADHLERLRWNGIYAQQHQHTGMVAYYLPLEAGARKVWATPYETFSCCQGTMIQAGTRHGTAALYRTATGFAVAQHLQATATFSLQGTDATVSMRTGEDPPPPSRADFHHGLPDHRPNSSTIEIRIETTSPVGADLDLHIPQWCTAPATVTVDGERAAVAGRPGSFERLRRTWTSNVVRLDLPRGLRTEELPGSPGTYSFLDGPVVLAGLAPARRTLRGDATRPETMLEQVGELEFGRWWSRFSTVGQDPDINLVPLHEVEDQAYTIYFPIDPATT